MTRALVDAYRERLERAIDALCRCAREPRRELLRRALEVEHLVLADMLRGEEEREVLRDLSASGRAAACREVFSALESVIERDVASLAIRDGHNLVEARDGIVANYLVRYEELARREALLARMSREDRVLFVGSGPLPISAIEYHLRTGCAVDCLDCVEDAIRVSSRAVERLGLDGGRVRCIHGRGEHLPVDGYTVVMVGVLAAPKEEILRNIATTAAPGLRLLLRTTSGLRELIYPPVPPELAGPGTIRDTVVSEARGDQVISTIGGMAVT